MLCFFNFVWLLYTFAVPCQALRLPRVSRDVSGDDLSSLTPAQLASLRQTHSIDQIPTGGGLLSGEIIYHDYVRWRGKAPPHIVEARNAAAAAAAPSNGTVQATDLSNETEFLTPLKIGSQTFNVILDTGSSTFWVFSDQLPASQRGTHSLYKETGKQVPNETWDISYVDGTGASGNVWYDNVTLAGITHAVAFGAANQASQSFTSKKQDGTIGFGFESGNTCSPLECFTFFQMIQPQLTKPIFASTLRKGKAGTYDFGFVDTSKYTGSLGFVTVDNSSSYWGITPSGYSIGSGSKVTLAFDTIADTGTALLYVPSAMLNAYYPKVKGAAKDPTNQYVYFPCNSTLPSLSLYIGSHKATVPGSYLNAVQVNATTCLGGMQDEGHVGSSIIGIAFLKSQYVVYDPAVPKIGFAQQKGLPST